MINLVLTGLEGVTHTRAIRDEVFRYLRVMRVLLGGETLLARSGELLHSEASTYPLITDGNCPLYEPYIV